MSSIIPNSEWISVQVVINIIENAIQKGEILRSTGEKIIQDIYHRTDDTRFKSVQNHIK